MSKKVKEFILKNQVQNLDHMVQRYLSKISTRELYFIHRRLLLLNFFIKIINFKEDNVIMIGILVNAGLYELDIKSYKSSHCYAVKSKADK